MTIEPTKAQNIEIPSRRKIARATLIALLAAVAILLIAVLPAEFGIDPLRTGRALGLIDLSKAASPSAVQAPAAEVVSEAPIIKGTFVPQAGIYKVDSRDLVLGPHEGVEIKYRMAKSAGMVYSWKSTEKLFYEFHGEPEGAPPDYFDSYEKDDTVGKDSFSGSFNAPTTGIHGWFWENPGTHVVTIHLATAGFYSYAKEFRDDKPIVHELKDAK